MSGFGGPRLIPTVPGGSSRPNKTSSVIKSKFSKLLLKPFCQITAELLVRVSLADLESTCEGYLLVRVSLADLESTGGG